MKQRMQHSKQQGFTLIELMIVVAIIGILAAVAVPQYQNYVTKSKWAGNLTAVQPLKLAISECLQNQGGVVASCDTLDELRTTVGYGDGTTTPEGTNIASVTLTATTAAIVITGIAAVNSCVVTMTPDTANTNAVAWTSVTSGTGCSVSQTGV
jgi:type IV pilus assembly protein PilA